MSGCISATTLSIRPWPYRPISALSNRSSSFFLASNSLFSTQQSVILWQLRSCSSSAQWLSFSLGLEISPQNGHRPRMIYFPIPSPSSRPPLPTLWSPCTGERHSCLRAFALVLPCIWRAAPHSHKTHFLSSSQSLLRSHLFKKFKFCSTSNSYIPSPLV